jgi:hypothetical protein
VPGINGASSYAVASNTLGPEGPFFQVVRQGKRKQKIEGWPSTWLWAQNPAMHSHSPSTRYLNLNFAFALQISVLLLHCLADSSTSPSLLFSPNDLIPSNHAPFQSKSSFFALPRQQLPHSFIPSLPSLRLSQSRSLLDGRFVVL